MAVRSSLLAGMPTTTVPSFLAATSVFSQSVCHSAADDGSEKRKAHNRLTTKAFRVIRFIDAASFR
jgi:hypothetical protein